MDQPKRKRGRPSKAEVAAREAAPAAAVPEKRKQGRPFLKAAGDAAADATPKEKRPRGRPRKSDISTAGGSGVEDRSAALSSPASASPASGPVSSGAKRKRGRPKKDAANTTKTAAAAAAAAAVEDEAEEASERRPKRRRKSVQDHEEEQEQADRRRGGQADRRRRKREIEPESQPEPDNENENASDDNNSESDNDDSTRQDDDNDADDALPSYGHLAPRMHMVSMATMKRKWAPLEQDAVAAIQALLAECARPVLARFRAGGGGAAGEQRQEQARQAIAGVTRRLRSKLVKGIPFPPATVEERGAGGKKRRSGGGDPDSRAGDPRAADFNFERAVEGIQALERQLTPLQHAVALLQREQAREEAALEADYAALRTLQTNAHAEARTWRARARKSHPLLEGGGDEADDDDAYGDGGDGEREFLELVKVKAEAEDTAFDTLDKDMLAVATQLGSHLESLRGNLQQIEGVVPAMARSQAALLQVLRTHLEPQQFEQILLG